MNGEEKPDAYKPTERADVDRRKSANPQQRPRRYSDGKKLRLKNEHGLMEFDVTIVSAFYDGGQHKWMYTLKDWKLDPIDAPKPEDALG